MNLVTRFWRSSLGKKYVMALTGAALFVFLIGHLVGNLQVFGPPELINGYAHFLKSKPGLLWGARLGLLGCVGLHIVAAVTLLAANRSARPEGYEGGTAYGSTLASRIMPISGLVVLAFVVYHLLHFTSLKPGLNGAGLDFSKLQYSLHGEVVPDAYAMMIIGFQVSWVTLAYLVAQALLFMHLNHGLSAMFQSLGLRNHVWWPRIKVFAQVASIGLFLGYASIPVAILAGGLGREHAQKAKAQLSLAPVGKEVVR